MADCTFCRIAAGDLPAHVVHEGGDFVAFLDHRPLFLGHTLLVPRPHVVTLKDLPSALGPGFFALAQRLERAVEAAMDVPGSMVLVNNVVSQSVPHLHLHVIPRRPKDGLRFWLGPRQRYPADRPAAAVAAAIRDRLTEA